MRIAVIGAGALGGTFATLLEGAGHEVTVTARGVTLAAIRADGIRLGGGFGDAHARPRAQELLTERPDLALVCTKAQDASRAIADNAQFLNGCPVIVVQNGLLGVDTASALLPDSECFGLLVIVAANYTEPGHVVVTTAAPSYLGRGSGLPDAETLRWQAVLGEPLRTRTISNFVGAQWTKLVVNMLNALPAITGLSVQEVIDTPRLRRILTASMRETVRVAQSRGVRFGSLQKLSNDRLRVFSRLPLWIGQALPLGMRARMGDVPNRGSTLQSIVRGQLTEIDFLNGAVVHEAEAAGITAPVNVTLTALVHEVEATGTHLAVPDVLARLASRTR
ncbi:ketopantoate reductase family protein [Cryobacterium sp. CG_9.6]|uniref:ketopantoate reductase family protein n=1 Tax=Cryobacterium sp. CG_9.6 TaxID=2760710 RepID=UPI002474164B|nr:ketopantoate reductase family protein [Cryobacterium sp. CG_9.6]MDH6236508.1 2-dehydropantoate 2-reductase [Cryobacterium sp. CG_9.6]